MSRVLDCTAGPAAGTDLAGSVAVRMATEMLRGGRLVVLPTDTVYGVAADAFDPVAVASLLAAKGRGPQQPPPVLVASPWTVQGLAPGVPPWAEALIDRFWPGPLTIVLVAQPSLRWDLGDTNGTVALRMPHHPLALAVLTQTGPLAVTSANRSGQPPATTVADALEQLGDAVEVYLDGGPCAASVASTIVDATGDAPVLLRPGALPPDVIDAVLQPLGHPLVVR